MATQPDALVGTCAKHYTERAIGRCNDCEEVYCAECLVPPTRKRMPTRCIDCALVAAGVRAPGQRRGMTNLTRSQKRPTNLW